MTLLLRHGWVIGLALALLLTGCVAPNEGDTPSTCPTAFGPFDSTWFPGPGEEPIELEPITSVTDLCGSDEVLYEAIEVDWWEACTPTYTILIRCVPTTGDGSLDLDGEHAYLFVTEGNRERANIYSVDGAWVGEYLLAIEARDQTGEPFEMPSGSWWAVEGGAL